KLLDQASETRWCRRAFRSPALVVQGASRPMWARLPARAVRLRARGFSASVDEVINLFQRHGSGDYIGEEVSQLEHALQAADLAARSGFGSEATIAALLHDVGHMLGLDDKSHARMEDCGIVDHENLGGQWLSRLGFSSTVCDLVARHVDAKRYLCAINQEYHDNLSAASKTTLRHQGGPMTQEALQYEPGPVPHLEPCPLWMWHFKSRARRRRASSSRASSR
ncbi:unnamed protein product, partial [Effrenium voratum]